VSLLPLTTAILRYAQIASSGGGGEPEDVVLHDRILQVCGVLWAVLMAVAVGV
jgi:decaprenyl-phosphate phosphoribosyltransferase